MQPSDGQLHGPIYFYNRPTDWLICRPGRQMCGASFFSFQRHWHIGKQRSISACSETLDFWQYSLKNGSCITAWLKALCRAVWLCLIMMHLKMARKNAFPRVKNELYRNGCKKCRGQRAQIQEVWETCTPHPLCPCHPAFPICQRSSDPYVAVSNTFNQRTKCSLTT